MRRFSVFLLVFVVFAVTTANVSASANAIPTMAVGAGNAQTAIPSSPEEVARAEAKYTIMRDRLSGSGSEGSILVIPDIPNNKQLSTSGFIPQPDRITCGPTSAHNLLKLWGKNVSLNTLKKDLLFDGNQTPFGDHWSRTLNRHTGSSYYVVKWAPDRSTLWAAFVGTTLDHAGFILDTHMSSKNGYLVGYSGGEWWHYVTGIGYQGYYSSTKYGVYFDPFNGRTGTYGVHKMPLDKFVPLVRDRGIVW